MKYAPDPLRPGEYMRLCDKLGCRARHLARGMCRHHYSQARWREDHPEVKHHWEHPERCATPGCLRAYYASGLCVVCYVRPYRAASRARCRARRQAAAA